MRKEHVFLFWLVYVLSFPADALVDPVEADIEEQDWMANILIKGSRSQIYSLFCKGSLIDEYWVLSSPACFIDPYDTISDSVGSDKAEYAVALGNLGGLFKVEERITSPDGNTMLLRLNRPATNKPISLLYLPATALRGVQVRIFGTETSAALADEFFNPVGSVPVTCRVFGSLFFSNSRMCYVLSRPIFHFKTLMGRGQLIDPLSADAPSRPLNSAVSPSSNVDRLYMDFIENKGYPCYEDLGSPIIATLNGELVQVGLVVAAGMTTGVPMCNDSFANFMSSLSGQKDFINRSLARGLFARQCPTIPSLRYEILAGTRVRFYWDRIYQVEGYKVLYTTALGYQPIVSIDIGNISEAIVNLAPGTTYSVALQAYNSECTGMMSAPVEVNIAAQN